MLEKFLNIFRIPDLRKRVLFTLGILAVYRLGAWIPTPGVNSHQLELMFNGQSGSALGLMDLFTGGTLRRMTIFALGIMPYITASIIFQLLTVVYEPLARIQKEGETRPAQNHAVDALPDRRSWRTAVDRHRGNSYADARSGAEPGHRHSI